MIDKKIYEKEIEKINEYFRSFFIIMTEEGYSEEEDILSNDRIAFLQVYLISNILLVNNIVEEGKETKYLIDTRTLKVNPKDNIEYVKFVIVNTVVTRMFDSIAIEDPRIRIKGLYYLFAYLGIIKVTSKKALKGSTHLVLANISRLILSSM